MTPGAGSRVDTEKTPRECFRHHAMPIPLVSSVQFPATTDHLGKKKARILRRNGPKKISGFFMSFVLVRFGSVVMPETKPAAKAVSL